MRRLQAEPEEVAAARKELAKKGLSAAVAAALGAFETAGSLAGNDSGAAALLAAVDAAALADVAEHVAQARARHLGDLLAEHEAAEPGERESPAMPSSALAKSVELAVAGPQAVAGSQGAAARALRLAKKLRVDPATTPLEDFRTVVTSHVRAAVDLALGFKKCLGVEPAGYLHL